MILPNRSLHLIVSLSVWTYSQDLNCPCDNSLFFSLINQDFICVFKCYSCSNYKTAGRIFEKNLIRKTYYVMPISKNFVLFPGLQVPGNIDCYGPHILVANTVSTGFLWTSYLAQLWYIFLFLESLFLELCPISVKGIAHLKMKVVIYLLAITLVLNLNICLSSVRHKIFSTECE